MDGSKYNILWDNRVPHNDKIGTPDEEDID